MDVSSRSPLCRSHTQGRETRRPPHRAGDEIRTDREHENREGARPDRTAVLPHARRSGDRMNRRHVLRATAAAAFVMPFFSHGQQRPSRIARIGFLGWASSVAYASRIEAFKAGLRELGYVEGKNVEIEYRFGDGRFDRLEPLAAELAARVPRVVVAGTATDAKALAKVAPNIPIVLAGGFPDGVVSNLARPGGMITGVSNMNLQVNEKHLELLLNAVPGLRRIGFLSDPNVVQRQRIEGVRSSVSRYSVEGLFAEASSASEIEPAILRLAKEGAQALVI